MENPADKPAVSTGELIGLLVHLRNRVESEWQRVLYVHAALIGVMIFFAGQSIQFVPARIVIAVFYTASLVVSWRAMAEAFDGLRIVTADLGKHPGAAAGSDAHRWLATRDYRHALNLRAVLMIGVWFVVIYLLFRTPVMGPG
jgi:hypothetical protein